MKLLKNPILWVIVVVIVVVVVGYKVMLKTAEEQEALRKKEKEKEFVQKEYNLYGIVALPPSTLLAAGSGGMLVKSTDLGATWQERQIASPEQVFTSISFPTEKHGWLVGMRGMILHTEDGGETWTRIKREKDADTFFMRVFFLDVDHGWIVGEMGTVLLTADGGKTWESVETEKYFTNFSDVKFHDREKGWIVGEQGVIMFSQDGGRTWMDQQSGTTKSLMTLTLSKSADNELLAVWAGGLEGTVLVTRDEGFTWEKRILRSGEEKIYNHVYKIYDKLSGTKGLGHHHVYTLCRGSQQYTFDGGIGWRLFMMDPETKAEVKLGWLHDMIFLQSSTDTLSRDIGWAGEVGAQGESNYGWLVGKGGMILRTVDSQNWTRVN